MFCPKCGSKISDGARFCGKCGNPVSAPEMNSVAKESVKSAVWPKVLVAGVVGVALVVGGILKGADAIAFVKSLFGPSLDQFYQKKFEYTMVVDSRDKQKYREIKIGEQVWLAQNMNYAAGNSVCDSCELYGRLYTHEDALDACPAGYALPSYWDYKALEANLNGTKSWFSVKGVAGGLDSRGFAAIPSGFYSFKDDTVKRRGIMAGFWLADYNGDKAIRVKIDDEEGTTGIQGLSRDYGFAVRCIKKSTSVANQGELLFDKGGNVYRTAKIGNQVWMAENLAYASKYSWDAGIDDKTGRSYGRFYAWKAAKKACPAGWRLPSSKDFSVLLKFLGKGSKNGKKLMSTSWNGSDVYSFGALPAGYQHSFPTKTVKVAFGEMGVEDCWERRDCNLQPIQEAFRGTSVFWTSDIMVLDYEGVEGTSPLDIGDYFLIESSGEAMLASGFGDGGDYVGASVRCLKNSK